MPEDQAQKPDLSENAGLLAQIVDPLSDRPSARVYENMKADPVVGEILGRKKVTYREMALVASAVVATLDDHIRKLEERVEALEPIEQRWKRLGTVINAPLIGGPGAVFNGDDDALEGDESNRFSEEKAHSASNEESAWFLRYLTLRNILGVLLIVITLSASFFAWYNRDYRSQLSLKDSELTTRRAQVSELTTERNQLTTQISEYADRSREQKAEFERLGLELEASRRVEDQLRTQLSEQRTGHSTALQQLQTSHREELGRLQDQLGKTGEEQVRLLQDQIAQLRSQLEGTAGELSTLQGKERNQAEELATLRATSAGTADELQRWKDLYAGMKQERDSLADKATALEAEVAEAEFQVGQARTAWNLLIEYLGKKRAGGRSGDVTLLRRDLDDQMTTIRGWAQQVPGMTQRIDR